MSESCPTASVSRRGRKMRPALTVIMAATFAAGCSGNDTAPPPPRSPVLLTPDMSDFTRDDGNCLGGGERPCAILLRTEPHLAAPIVNADPNSTNRVNWPLERYGSSPGDALKILCSVEGDEVYDPGRTATLSTWYKIRVSRDEIKNPALTTPPAEAYAAARWFGRIANNQVAPC